MRVERGPNGRSRVVELDVAPPLGAKVRVGDDDPELVLVGSAASLLEGDRLAVAVEVGAGATLAVRSVAAQLAHPCPNGRRTSFAIAATLGAGARLIWSPEPTIVCGGGRHVTTATIVLAAGAVAVWRDELVLGRSGERPLDVDATTELVADHDDRPLLRDGVTTAAAHAFGPGVLGDGTRFIGAVHLLGRRDDPETNVEGTSRFSLAGPGTTWRLLSMDVAAGRAAIHRVMGELSPSVSRAYT